MPLSRKSSPGKKYQHPVSNQAMPAERAEIISWLKKVRFRRRIFGGVDEQNVWRKISELDQLYTKALEAERIRYDTLLAAKPQDASSEIPADPKGSDPDG